MILYNIRYRGPFEYDKFALNIFQMYNETKHLIKDFNEEKETIAFDKKRNIEQIYNQIVNEKSILEQILKLTEEMRDLKND